MSENTQHDPKQVEAINGFVTRFAEENEFGFEWEVIVIELSYLSTETGIPIETIREILTAHPINDPWLSEQCGCDNVYAGPYFDDSGYEPSVFYCVPGSTDDVHHKERVANGRAPGRNKR
jgi:hypothetical protein